MASRSITSPKKLGLDCNLFRRDILMFIKASDVNLSWLCEFLKWFFNLSRAENERSSTALVTAYRKFNPSVFTKQCTLFKTSNVISRMSFVTFVNVNIIVTSSIKHVFFLRKQETGPTG
jgi:hypothetical protein